MNCRLEEWKLHEQRDACFTEWCLCFFQTVHGKHCRHPFTDRLLPIITDSMVDVELGTGEDHT